MNRRKFLTFAAALLLCIFASCSESRPDLVLQDKDGNTYLLTDCFFKSDYPQMTTCRVNKIPK
jgi:hypothetical protein